MIILKQLIGFFYMDRLTRKAKNLATSRHSGQMRKFDGTPYIVHPERVARRAKHFTKDHVIIQAAFLHDVIEDTDTTYQEIKQAFGKPVADLVQELTSKNSGIKKYGKTDYLIYKMNRMSKKALTIKLLDRLDNVSDFPTAPIKFKNKYKEETIKVLSGLEGLTFKHKRIIKEIYKKIEK